MHMTRITAIAALVAVVIVSAISTPTSAQIAPAAESLLVRSIGGPEALRAVRDMRTYQAFGSASLNGLEGTYRELYLAPDKLFLEVDAGPIKLVQAYDGHTAWQRDHNGRISKLGGWERREMLKSVYLESFAFVLPGRLPGGVDLMADTTINDTLYRQIAIHPMNRDTVLMLLDPQSGIRKFVISRMDALVARTEFSDWRTIDHILVPFVQNTEVAGAPIQMTFTTDSVRLNQPIDPTVFDYPAQSGADYRFGGAGKSVTIPFTYYRGHIWVQATLNGRLAAWFLLDSGASANLLNKPKVDSLNLPKEGELPAMGLAGFENVALVRTDSIQIGQLVLTNQIAGSFDLSPLGLSPGPNRVVGGILGHDFLSRFPILINYQDSTLTVYNPDGFEPPSGGVEIPFHLTMLVPTISASVDSIRGDFIVDLGNAFGLVLHQRFADAKRLDTVLVNSRDVESQLGGIGGTVGGMAGRVPRFRMGDVVINDLPALIPEGETGLAGSAELAGNIGNMVLERFRVLFDYGNARLILYDPAR